MLAKKRKGATEKRKGSSGIASLLWMFVGALLTLMIGLFLYLWNPFNTNETAKPTEPRTVTPRTNTERKVEREEYEFYELLPQQEVSSIPDEAVTPADDKDLDDTQRALQEMLLEPDVVVTAPKNNSATDQDNAAVAATGNSEMVIIEEEGTYDGNDTPSNNNQSNRTTASLSEANNPPAQVRQSVTQTVQAKPESQQSITNAKPRNTYILQINSFSNAEEADGRRAQVLMAGVDAQVVKKQMPNGQVFYQVVTPPIQIRQAIIAEQQRLQNNGIDSLIVEQRR